MINYVFMTPPARPTSDDTKRCVLELPPNISVILPENTKKDSQSISVRLPAELVSIMDERAKEWNMNRSKLITQGIAEFVFSKKCPSCGIVNPSLGKICSVCGQPLDRDEELEEALHNISERIMSESGLPTEMPGGYYPHFTISKTVKDRNTQYAVNYLIHSPNGDVLVPAEKQTVYYIHPQDIADEIMEKEFSVVLSNGKKMKVVFED